MLEKVPPKQRFQLIGEVVSLFLASGLHRRCSLNEFADNVIPALDTNQFKIFKQGDFPVAFVSWAYLSDAVETTYKTCTYQLTPDDFHSGTNLWFIDFIAPFGHAEKVIDTLRTQDFANNTAKYIRSDEKGTVRKIVSISGINV
jgi:cytolysin-activating lysine-acyltransferase